MGGIRAFLAELDAQLPSAHFAKALNEYNVHKRFDQVLAHLDRALAREPNFAEAMTLRGWTLRRLGRWEETYRAFARAVELNPRNPHVLTAAGDAAAFLRRYALGADYFERAVAAAPEDPQWRIAQANHAISWYGDLTPLRALADDASATLTPRDRWQVRWDLASSEHRFDNWAAIINEGRPEWFPFHEGVYESRDFFLAWAARYRGDQVAMRHHALEAIRTLDPALEKVERPTTIAMTRAHAALMVDDTEGARRWSELALANARLLNDAARVVFVRQARITLLAWSGERDAALQELESLLAQPSGAHAAGAAIRPAWTPLHDDPRFKALIEKYRPRD